MSATFHLSQAVTEALAALPADSDEIAALFTDLGITGRTGDAVSCPVANYLGGEVKDSGAQINVGGPTVYLRHEADPTCVELEAPKHVAEFADRFDQGDFPLLETGMAPLHMTQTERAARGV